MSLSTPGTSRCVGAAYYITEPLVLYLMTPRTIAPGARQRVMWKRVEGSGSGDTEAGAPGQVTGVVSYRDDFGSRYHETYDLSVDTVGAWAPAPTEGPRAMGSGKVLANIEKAIRTLSTHIGELRR